MVKNTKLYLALPVLVEFGNLATLIGSLKAQSETHFHLVVCVNHYEHWRLQPEYASSVADNEKSLEYLRSIDDIQITLIDKASPGKGWPHRKGGVGWARKVAMDYIAELARPEDAIVSIDADTYYPPNYLEEVKNSLVSQPKAVGVAVPYYHNLAGDDTDRLILRYELYMRHYALNMLRNKNPYGFTAIGSAMAFPVWAYKKAGGMTPVISGEDFYFMQKLVKLGRLVIWADTVAYPSPRFSDRVIFGTGPALIKGKIGDWSSYPFYHPHLFDEVGRTFSTFASLYPSDLPTPMDDFLFSCFKTDQIWQPLRKNYRSLDNFVRACMSKVDGLRILQYLRIEQLARHYSDAKVMVDSYEEVFQLFLSQEEMLNIKNNGFESLTLNQFIQLRDVMFIKENSLRKELYFNSL